MYSRVETIDPLLARVYLSKNKANRKLKPTAISRYARDMKNGKWQLSPQGISFYESGNLADGQNRLNAIIEAGVAVDMYVTYDVPNDSTVQDRGVARSTTDVLHMSGITSDAGCTTGVALINCLFDFASISSITDITAEEFAREYEDQLCKAISATRRSKDGSGMQICKKAAVSAAVFCALICGIDVECLNRFCTVANTGFQSKPEESAAIVLRNALIQNIYPATRAGRKDLFALTTNAIKDFAQGNPKTKKYRADIQPVFWKYTKDNCINKYLATYQGMSKKAISHYISAESNAATKK